MPEKPDPKTAGSAFLTEVLAKAGLAGEKAETVKALFADPEFAKVVEGVGAGVLRQSEFSRKLDEVTQHQATLNAWYDANKAKLAEQARLATENAQLKTQLTDADADGRTPLLDPTKYYTRDEVEKLLDRLLQERFRTAESQFVPFVETVQMLSDRHRQEFGEGLDLPALRAHSAKMGLFLPQAYDDLVKERREQKAVKDLDEKLKRAREEGASEARKSFTSMPFPTTTAVPSTLDGLEKPPDTSIDALVAAHNAVVAERQGRTP